MKYVVRDSFFLKKGREVFKGGDVVELDDDEVASWANIIEPAEKPAEKPARKAKVVEE